MTGRSGDMTGGGDFPAAGLELAKYRCASLQDRVTRILPPSKISDSCRRTLLRLLTAELRFLSSVSPSSVPFSLNVGYLESIVRILEQPSVTRVSRVCKAVVPQSPASLSAQRSGRKVHVDIVCTLGQSPVWFLVSDRNPKYISWSGYRRSDGGLKARVERIISAARSTVSLKPESVILFFSKGLSEAISKKLVDDLGASEMGVRFSFPEMATFEELEGGWVNVVGMASRVFEIKIDSDCCARGPVVKLAEGEHVGNKDDSNLGSDFSQLILKLKSGSDDVSNEELINLDTTALIAFVSGISNGGTSCLLKSAEVDVKKKFKGNYEFVMAQVMAELQNPIIAELRNIVGGRRGIICESVLSEFKDLVSMYGGMREKARADQLLKSLVVVSDSSSTRISGLPTTRKIAFKNKVIFGTGDHWHAPTLTANIGFVRAISQTGMSLLTIEHRPCALIGD